MAGLDVESEAKVRGRAAFAERVVLSQRRVLGRGVFGRSRDARGRDGQARSSLGPE